ncbi:MAG: Fe-S oxidoreductase [Beggiatoa sp. IS2]|nr:MAG: Fe-S oxidoreductase [Beggiatoa sp. IS2]
MALLSIQQEQLREKFRARVSFDEMERRIYSHDVGDIPKLIKPLIGKSLADAVVQPENEAELIGLVKFALENQIPLVPRAKATSGYGGILPVRGGIVVSFRRFRNLLEFSKENLTVKVQPGIVWERLNTLLEREGLTLRLYPSSAPSSTVGGWLAQGGFGYGSFEYGAFKENVISARVVLPTGEVREFAKDDLDLISDAEGITGFITEVTLALRPLEQEKIVGACFQDSAGLINALMAIVKAELPLWSLSFINPMMAHLKNQMPPKLRHGHPVHNTHKIPEGYVVTFVYPETRADKIGSIKSFITNNGGYLLSDEIAHHEWEERFKVMSVKRIGPSLIPSEVVVPLPNLGKVLDELQARIHQPLALEGMVLKGNTAMLLGFIPHDYRKFGFNMAFSLPVSVIKIAKKHGGRSYATGLFFAHDAESILGPERVHKLRQFKEHVDHLGIMNPGKVLNNGLLGIVTEVSEVFEVFTRFFGNAAKAPVGQHIPGTGKRGIPDDIAWYAHACAQCGYCVDECDQFYGRNWESQSPRGKWFFLREYMRGKAEMTQEWVNRFLACTTCEFCNVKCPLDLPIESSWLNMRGHLIHEKGLMTFPPFEMMAVSLKQKNNIWASCGAHGNSRTAWIPDKLRETIKWDGADIAYFGGCTASFVETDVAIGAAHLLNASGIEFTHLGEDETCCGLPMLAAGKWDAFADVVHRNVKHMTAREVKTVVTSCPACWLAWRHLYPDWSKKLGIPFHFKVRHYTEVLSERIKSGDLKFTHEVPKTVTWHDSCHMGRAGDIYDPPRDVIKALPGIKFVEMEFNRENAHCCGGVLSLLDDLEAAKSIGGGRIREAEETGAEALVATCPCCQVQLRVSAQKNNSKIPIVDLAHLAAEGLGIYLPDPTEYAMKQWATYESMIQLLKPEAMAEFMATLLPEMVEAMPQPYRGFMKWTKGASHGVQNFNWNLMKPMLPMLFPRLLPGMMPKVLPEMLAAMERRIPMPHYMKEQMPDMMPEVMSNLLPKMLPLMMPFFLPKLEGYLKNNSVQAR